MNIYADKIQENKNHSVANSVSQKMSISESTFQFVDNRPETVTQRKMQVKAQNNPQANQVAQLQTMADNHSSQQQNKAQKKENNTGLPDSMKSGIENLSGYSMNDVKVHYNSDKPAQLQAYAYAQGTNIHLASGQERHLPHEAWHVVQQKQGRVKPTMQMQGKMNVNDDVGLEREADVMGAKALQLKLNGHESSHMDRKREPTALKNPNNPIQRRLIVNAVNYTTEYQKTDGVALQNTPARLIEVVDAVFALIQAAVVGTDIEAAFAANNVAIKRQLTKWIEDQPGLALASAKSHPVFGRKSQVRNYANFEELGRGLLGWVGAKPGRRNEKAAAAQVAGNEAIEVALNSLIRKLHLKITNLSELGLVTTARATLIHTELSTSMTADGAALGTYEQYINAHAGPANPAVASHPMTILSSPETATFRDKIAILHDLMEYFMAPANRARRPQSQGEGLLPEISAAQTRVTTEPVPGVLTRTHTERGTGLTSGTRDETDPGTIFSRSHNIPVWASQSYTTGRMLNLGQWAGANKEETTALAYGIFAFWRKDYDHTSIAYHTLHEVMDIAVNFGVTYDPLNQLAALPGITLDALTGNINGYVLPLRTSINALLNTINKWRNITAAQKVDIINKIDEIDVRLQLIQALQAQLAVVGLTAAEKKIRLTQIMQYLSIVQSKNDLLNRLVTTLPHRIFGRSGIRQLA